ncbi:MAG: NAD(P)/FAD-dependent oxidoreductase [Thermoleophilia bacterium]
MVEAAGKASYYDVIVVGSGPAGVSAAINVANRRRTVAVIGGRAPFERLRKAHSISNYPGFGVASGEELAAAFLRHLEEFAVPLIAEKASKIIPAEGSFVVFSEREVYHAGAVVLATGVYREAEVEGEEELVGQGVSYCVTCDGRLFAGRRGAFISYAPEGEEEAAALAEDYGVDVTYLPLYQGDYRLPAGVRVLPEARPARLERVEGSLRVSLPGEDLQVDAVFIYKNSVSPRTLLEGLTSDGRHVTVGRHMETGVPGVFAAGDCTGEPYQTAKAVGEGQVAALQAVRFLRARQASETP